MTIQKIELQKIEVLLFWALYLDSQGDFKKGGTRWHSIRESNETCSDARSGDRTRSVSYCP